MCGIVGIRRFDQNRVEVDELRSMAAKLSHRGRDDQGTWSQGPIGLGHKRLSIIDLEGSKQPMSAGQVHVCFNGEIFNYAQLRQEFTRRGYAFHTQGDTEVLLAAYLLDGVDGVKQLDGQFAYGIVDERQGDLILYRDRLGIQPLYYHWDGKIFLFASELKALLPQLSGGLEIDGASVKEYLGNRYVTAPFTLLKGVRKLPPGHCLRLDSAGNLSIEAYWELPTKAASQNMAEEEALSRVSAALENAVRSRMVADVPVGAYLSGGLDSSLIVALMTKVREGAPVETFSAGFNDPHFDERSYALQVSTQLGTKHHEVLVEPRDLEDLWSKLTWHRDAPISEPSDVAFYRLASLASKRVKVLLSGEGSDELFAGYPKYSFARIASLVDGIPATVRLPLLRAFERCLPERAARVRIMLRAMASASAGARAQSWFASFVKYERDQLIPGIERDLYCEFWSQAQGDVVARMLYADCRTWLADNLLERGDRMSMAATVESRPPFLDHHLVELAFAVPSRFKVRNGTGKWLIKEIARRYLPDEIVDRTKVGFRLPMASWFRGRLRDMTMDMLLSKDAFVGSQLDRASVAGLLDSHMSGRRDEQSRIWTLLALEIWYQVFFRDGGQEIG